MDLDKETVLLLGQNLFFSGRVEASAEPQGYEVQRATTELIFWDHYASCRPGLIFIDLEGDEPTWSNVLKKLNQQKLDGVKVVAFGPHENVAALDRARNLGCDLVLNKGEFNRDLAKIISSIGVNSG